ncbi:MAG: nucleoside triphosphate pyrophosphohydrolase [bacterium]|nr:nucleoside triphosphate pyrophosphohydrolase [bacterium]
MDDRPPAERHPAGQLTRRLVVTGLGPGTLDRTPADVVEILSDPANLVVLRTLQHPAAAELAGLREVVTCDDLYDIADTFEEVYEGIAQRVLDASAAGDVVYAVPGSPVYGERSVAELRARCRETGRTVRVIPAPSFLDEVFTALEVDPTERGFTLLDGRDLPDPLMLHLPTVVFQVDTELVLDDVLGRFRRTLPPDTPITVLSELGTPEASVVTYPIDTVPVDLAGLRTSLFLDPPGTGLVGAIKAMRRLRVECPWDRRQTHESLTPYAVEEVFELLEAIGRLPSGSPDVDHPDYVAYADVEDELGDVLLQVIFHSNLASEAGAFDVEDVAERLLRKLVHRHPHVFGDVRVSGAEEVIANWQAIKAEGKPPRSLMDGVPEAMPGLERAVKLQRRASRVGFDWPDARSVIGDVEEELAELVEVLDRPEANHELGDVLFAVANLARHLDVEPEMALRRAVQRFETRFRRMEELDDLESADLGRLDALWEQAKSEEK